MSLPGHPHFYPTITTDAGEDVYSKVQNVVEGWIKPSAGPGITYDPGNMWHSSRTPRKEATLEFEFPFEVKANGIAIHSQHSGKDHEVTAMKLELIDDSKSSLITEQPVTEVDATLKFGLATGRKWKLTLTTGKSGILVIRGIRFLKDNKDVFPHMVPNYE